MDNIFGDIKISPDTLEDTIQEKVGPDISKDGAKDGAKKSGKYDAKDEDDDEEKSLDNNEVQAKKKVGMSMAKPCITKAVDYTMLELLLLVQYTRCKRPSVKEMLIEAAESGALDPNKPIKLPNLSCDTEQSLSFVASENAVINAFVMTAISVGVFYGLFCGIVVWYHSSRKAKDVEIHPVTEKLYNCTDRFIMIDSLLEIPISFFWAPYMTAFLWFCNLIAIVGLFFLSRNYNEIMIEDENAQAVFFSSTTVTGISLLKLTGEVSQYWVKYTASVSWDTRKKYAETIATTPLGETSRILF